MRNSITRIFSGQFTRFVVVGGVSALTEYTLYFLFKSSVNYLIANVLAFALTNILTFALSRRYVFCSTGNNRTEEATLFVVCLLGALLVNQMVLWIMVEFIHIDDHYGKALAIGVTVFWNFFTRKHIVFKSRPAEAVAEPSKEYRSKRI